MKNQINNRIKENFDGYYGKNKLKDFKDIRYLFNEKDEPEVIFQKESIN